MEKPHCPDQLRSALFNRSKFLWGAGLTFKLLVFVAGAVVVLYPANAKLMGFVALVLGLVSEAVLWRSDKWKGDAQSLHRKLDFENCLGWPVTNGDVADLLARYPGNLLNKLSGSGKGSYFASKEPPGVKRALQNLCESSWWSMHLAESMFQIFTVVIVGIIVVCVVLLNISVESLPIPGPAAGQATRDVVSASLVKIVTSSLLFIVSYGLVRLAVGYHSFSQKSKQIKEKAESLLEAGCDEKVSAIKLWQEYHLSRASAPLLPTWIWWCRQKKLNILFKTYFQDLV